MGLGGAMPWLFWRTRRRDRSHGLVDLVPDEVAAAYRRVITAASAPGVGDPVMVIESADDVLLEVAAVLVGRPVHGGVLRRFVAVRTAFLTDLADDLDDRAAAWAAAMAELEVISPAPAPREPTAKGDGTLVTVLVVVLAPLFLAWDLTLGTGRAARALVVGVVLRIRMAGRLTVAAGRAVAMCGIRVL